MYKKVESTENIARSASGKNTVGQLRISIIYVFLCRLFSGPRALSRPNINYIRYTRVCVCVCTIYDFFPLRQRPKSSVFADRIPRIEIYTISHSIYIYIYLIVMIMIVTRSLSENSFFTESTRRCVAV